jgi:hypothetical protein
MFRDELEYLNSEELIKCNDAGVRIVESQCDKTVGEWLDENEYCVDGLVHDHVLGPDLAFSPLVFVKVSTKLSL